MEEPWALAQGEARDARSHSGVILSPRFSTQQRWRSHRSQRCAKDARPRRSNTWASRCAAIHEVPLDQQTSCMHVLINTQAMSMFMFMFMSVCSHVMCNSSVG